VALHRLQRLVKFDLTGLHILRHSGITYLADQGEDVYTVQAFARHARLQTTQGYIHQSKQRLVGKAARTFDGNRLATPGN
jgi:site-specific recombinase XerD